MAFVDAATLAPATVCACPSAHCGNGNHGGAAAASATVRHRGVPRAPKQDDLQVPGPHLPSLHKNATGSGGGSRSYIAAACDDWLLFSDAYGLFRLTSPFTGKTRHLPSFHDIHADDRPVDIINEPSPRHDAMATGEVWRDDKTMAVRKVVVCPDGFIAANFGREHFAKVALCSLETFSWTHSVHDRWRPYDDLEFHGGKLYAVTAGADLLAIDVGFDGETGRPSVSRVDRVIVGGAISSFHYLVPSDDSGELLMVRRQFPNAYYAAMGGSSSSSRSRFAVFRADLASARWEEVRYLGDGEAVFVGRMCSRKVTGRRLSGRENGH
nr:unnamed protein product [Digitaria exilis]